MAKRRKKRTKPIKKILALVPKLLLVGLVLGGYYIYKNPDIIINRISTNQDSNESNSPDSKSSEITLNNFVSQEQISNILGKTTGLVQEGLENIKVPKQLTGSDEEIVIEDAFNQFSQKIKDLPAEQVDRIKIQVCKDILESVDSASVVVEE
jgi:hypothetical protein